MPFVPRSPLVRDLLIGVAVMTVAQLELALVASEIAEPVIWHHAANLLIVPAFGLRRRAPLGSIVVIAVGLVSQPLVGPAAVAIPYLALLYLLASFGWFSSFRAGLVGVAVTLVSGLAYDTVTGAAPAADIVVNAALIILAWASGRGLRVATDRRVVVEVESARTARDAVERERGRIARDMHDSLGHALTLMTLQAGSARERVDQPVASEALQAIEEAGREALSDLHRVLGLLGSEADTGKGLGDLPDLVAGVHSSGLQVELEVRVGGAVPNSVANAMYRVVQEALTNIARHSHANCAQVQLCLEEDALVTVVTDPGPATRESSTGTGRGLIGLRQRLALFDGTLEARPVAGGWRTEARIPLPQRSP